MELGTDQSGRFMKYAEITPRRRLLSCYSHTIVVIREVLLDFTYRATSPCTGCKAGVLLGPPNAPSRKSLLASNCAQARAMGVDLQRVNQI